MQSLVLIAMQITINETSMLQQNIKMVYLLFTLLILTASRPGRPATDCLFPRQLWVARSSSVNVPLITSLTNSEKRLHCFMMILLCDSCVPRQVHPFATLCQDLDLVILYGLMLTELALDSFQNHPVTRTDQPDSYMMG